LLHESVAGYTKLYFLHKIAKQYILKKPTYGAYLCFAPNVGSKS